MLGPFTKETIMGDLQRQVQQAIDELVESGAERGLQVAVYQHGEQVVDAVAGLADPAADRPVTPATVFYSFSVVKAAASTIVHRLVERGLFGYDTPVAELWPEFAARGKQAITVRQVLNHTAHAIARLYAALLGEVDGVWLLPPERLAAATAVSSSGTDEIFGMPTTWALGWSLGLPSPTAFGVGGVGGSFAFGDPASGVAFAVTKNRLSPDFATATQLMRVVTGAR